MDFGKSFKAAFLPLKSVDFWLFMTSFGVSSSTLQSLPTVANQVLAIGAILAVCIAISFIFKRRSSWARKPASVKDVLSALGVMLFVGYAICAFSVSLAGRRDMELSGA